MKDLLICHLPETYCLSVQLSGIAWSVCMLPKQSIHTWVGETEMGQLYENTRNVILFFLLKKTVAFLYKETGC